MPWTKQKNIGITNIFVKIHPSLLYSISTVNVAHDYGLDIPGNVIEEMYDNYGHIVLNFRCTNDCAELVLILMRENSLSNPINSAEAVNLYLSLLNITNNFKFLKLFIYSNLEIFNYLPNSLEIKF